MYVSKHFTCEEIDQRLLQGYYDDFVTAGFVGTLQEFLQFVLSIQNRVTHEELDEADTNIYDKITEEVQKLNEAIEAQKVTKVSQLENDSNYATVDNVKEAINNLVNGSVEALDTIKELAEALGNDADFAGTMARKLTELKEAITAETTRAKEAESFLLDKIGKTDENLANAISELREIITSTYNRIDEKVDIVMATITSLQETYRSFTEEVNNKLTQNKKELHAEVEDAKTAASNSATDLQKSIEVEKARAEAAENTITDSVNELKESQSDYEANIDNQILSIKQGVSDESVARQQADSNLTTKINEEAVARANADANLQTQISDEVVNRTKADQSLSERITDEVGARTLADHKLQDNINTAVSESKERDKFLEEKISELTEATDTSTADLAAKITQEITNRKTADESKVDKVEGMGLSEENFTTLLLTKLNSIQYGANKIEKVSELINDKGYQTAEEVSTAIAAVIDSAPEALNTLKELSEALGNDPNFAATLTTQLTTLATQLNQELQDRKNGDSALASDLATKYAEIIAKIEAAETTLTTNINTLSTQLASLSAIASEAKATSTEVAGKLEGYDIPSLKERVNTLRDDLDDLDSDIDQKIKDANKELVDRIILDENAIAANTARIQDNLALIQELLNLLKNVNEQINQAVETEAQLRKVADEVLQSKIDSVALQVSTEATIREQNDNLIKVQIEKEEIARQTALQEVQRILNNEISERESSEEYIQEDIADLQERVKALEGKTEDTWLVNGSTVEKLDFLHLDLDSYPNLTILGKISPDTVRVFDWNTGLIIPNFFRKIPEGVTISLEYYGKLEGVTIEIRTL